MVFYTYYILIRKVSYFFVANNKISYTFVTTQMMDTIKFYLYYLDSLFIGYPFVIRMTVSLIMLLISLYVIAMIRIVVTVRKRKRDNARRENISERFGEKLRTVLLTEQEMSFFEAKDLLNPNDTVLKNWEIRYITDLVIQLKEKPSFNDHNYTHLLEIFPLLEFWEKKFQKDDIGANKKALRIMAQIKEGISGSLFTKKINSNEASLRKHVKSEYLKYASNDAFKFLENNFDKDFNGLDGVRLHESLKERDAARPLPLLTKWLKNSEKESYQSFIIKEIGYFEQKAAAPYLVEFFKETDSVEVKSEIANTLGLLKYEDAISLLAQEYPYQNTVVQEAIIDMMGEMRTKKAFDFLKEIYPQTQNNETVIKIIKNLYKIDKRKTNTFIQKSAPTSFEKETLAYIKHNAVTSV